MTRWALGGHPYPLKKALSNSSVDPPGHGRLRHWSQLGDDLVKLLHVSDAGHVHQLALHRRSDHFKVRDFHGVYTSAVASGLCV